MRLYSGNDIDNIPWPKTIDGKYAKDYFRPLLLNGTSYYIKNVKSEIYMLIFNNKVIPITIANPKLDNCYVCSPFDHYTTYAKDELKEIKNPFIKKTLATSIYLLAIFLRVTKINNAVYVNNWFLSTNLYPELTQNDINHITRFLKNKFPDKVILFRSINKKTTGKIYTNLTKSDYKMIVSRQVYITDPKLPHYKKKKDYKSDYNLRSKSNYKLYSVDSMNKFNSNRILDLYNDLYINKHSRLNPQFTVSFIQSCIDKQLLTIKPIVSNGKTDAVMGYFSRNNIMTTPLFGYDSTVSKKEGLYRLLSSYLVSESEEKKLILNQSSGASKFKRTRGATPVIEYTAFYDQHVCFIQRIGWRILRLLLNGIGVPLLKKLKL